MEILELRRRLTITEAWPALGLRGFPGRCVCSPFREDRNPSLSIWRAKDGLERFKDHAANQSGDPIDFVKLAHGCTIAEAIQWIEHRLGIPRPERKSDAAQKSGAKLPPLRPGTLGEHRELAERRGFNPAALRLAEKRGFLWFTTLWGHAAWCVTDQRRQLHEFRRVDCEQWPEFGRLSKRKCHCLGAGKRWPIGTMESQPFAKVAIVEGAPDFLAAIHFLLLEQKERDVAPVAILGASNHALAPEALAQFKGKLVCLYPHVDDAGRTAARAWARQLKEAGAARVTGFDLSGLMLVDGRAGKDLADVCRISADCLEHERKFGEVLP